MTETVNGTEVRIARKRIRTLRLTVDRNDGAVRVSAPYSLSKQAILDFVASKQDWIDKQRQKALTRIQTASNDCRDGGYVWLWGEKLPVRAISGKKTALTYKDGFLFLTLAPDADAAKIKAAEEKFYKKELEAAVALRLPLLEEGTGLKCSAWDVRKMVSRWGSCNIKTKKVRFSLNLAKKPSVCLDYVIVHELLHTLLPDHGARFKRLLEQYYPGWQSVKKLLNG